MLPKCDIVLISINSPIIIGVYEDSKLVYEDSKSGKTSDILPDLFYNVMQNYKIKRIFYSNGPGNFSAIKLTHIFIQTFAIISDIKIFCTDSFSFTKDKFINAYGRIHFFKEDGIIKTIELTNKKNTQFELPQIIDCEIFSNFCLPLYILPAL